MKLFRRSGQQDWHFAADDPAAVTFFDEHGFVAFPDLLRPEELAELRAAAKGAKSSDTDLAITHDAIFAVPAFEPFARRLAPLAAKLIGHPVELQNSKFNAKPLTSATGGTVEWHQDYPFFPHTNFDLLAGVIHLDDEGPESGPLESLPGSHKRGPLSHCLNGEFVGRCTAEVHGEPVTFTCKAGTVFFHHCLTLHRSGPKTVPGHRRHLIFEYRAQDAVQIGGKEFQSAGHEVMPRERIGVARFPDATVIERRGFI